MRILLIVIGMLLIVINIGAFKKDKPKFKETFNSKKEGLNDFNVEIFNLRKDFSETILEIQKELESIKNDVNTLKEKSLSKEDEKVLNAEKKDFNYQNTNKNASVKVIEVHKLLEQGLSIDEIAEKMSISKGEALLIKGLYTR